MKKCLFLTVAFILVLSLPAAAQTAAELIEAGNEASDQRNDAKALEYFLAAVRPSRGITRPCGKPPGPWSITGT